VQEGLLTAAPLPEADRVRGMKRLRRHNSLDGKVNRGMDARTEELRDAHDVLSEWYAKNLVGVLESMPVERAMLDLFAEMTLAVGAEIADVGCGTGRLLPYLASRGLSPRGVDLSPRMVEVAQREHPGFAYEVADLRELPFECPDQRASGLSAPGQEDRQPGQGEQGEVPRVERAVVRQPQPEQLRHLDGHRRARPAEDHRPHVPP
jgi:SAM-dependent methyltransferase